MAIVTLSVELGAETKRFANELAHALDSPLLDFTRVERSIAIGVPPWSTLRFAHSGHQTLGACLRNTGQAAARLSEGILMAAATHDRLVIASWCAPIVLTGIAIAIRLRIQAPMLRRLEVVQREFAYPTSDVAQVEIGFDDDAARRLFHDGFAADWRDPAYFDDVIDAQGRDQGSIADIMDRIALRLGRVTDAEKVVSKAMIESRMNRLLANEISGPEPLRLPAEQSEV